jgi:hypothetical protein
VVLIRGWTKNNAVVIAQEETKEFFIFFTVELKAYQYIYFMFIKKNCIFSM